jgi:hypothetical protein
MPTAYASSLLLWGLVAHGVADWLLQNSWMADHKASLRHPAAWVHGGIHLAALSLVFPLLPAALLAAVHMGIDTRTPLAGWRRVFRQTTTGPVALSVAIWSDQAAHVACLAAGAWLTGRFYA